MDAIDKNIFMDHTEHDEKVNIQNYQCPQGMHLVGKMLSNADKGMLRN
jgi:hypothetical protein